MILQPQIEYGPQKEGLSWELRCKKEGRIFATFDALKWHLQGHRNHLKCHFTIPRDVSLPPIGAICPRCSMPSANSFKTRMGSNGKVKEMFCFQHDLKGKGFARCYVRAQLEAAKL